MKENFDEIRPDGVSYSNIKSLIHVFEHSEYDNLSKAAAEIVDNAIDANATSVIVFLHQTHSDTKGKEVLDQIAFLDNGDGMSPGKLQHIVGFGTSTNTNGGSIGKFGIGLNQASLFACDKFTVYSWQNEDEIYKEVFDKEYIIANNIDKAPVPERTKLPAYITSNYLFQSKFKDHGTLVVWSNLKSNKVKRPVTVESNFKDEFGRIFRYYLNYDLVEMFMYRGDNLINIEPIDPMFLMEKNVYLGDKDGTATLNEDGTGEPLFEPFTSNLLDEDGYRTYEVPYYDDEKQIRTSIVTIRASIVKDKFYYRAAYKSGFNQPGDSPIGKVTVKLQKGITVVRNKREIDFKLFDFYDSKNQPQDRWFKIEINFGDELDTVFNVSNNKQHVELKQINDSKMLEYDDCDPDFPIWLRLEQDIKKLVSEMRSTNKSRIKALKAEEKEKEDTGFINNIKNFEQNTLEDVLKRDNVHITANMAADVLNDNNNTQETITLSLQANSGNDEIKLGNYIDNSNVVNTAETKIKHSLENNKNENPIINRNFENNSYYKENNVLVCYEDNLNKWLDYYFDFSSKKFIIKFDTSKIRMSKLNYDVEHLIVIICLNIINSISPNVSDALNKILDEYFIFLCNE